MTTESALVVLVPEAEPLVGPYRELFDSSAAAGLGAHITLLYPFVEPGKIGESTFDALVECFRSFAPIAFSLTEIRRFSAETLYLVPDPDEPFRQLTMAIWERFPDRPPYGGAGAIAADPREGWHRRLDREHGRPVDRETQLRTGRLNTLKDVRA